MLQNENLLKIICADTADNEPNLAQQLENLPAFGFAGLAGVRQCDCVDCQRDGRMPAASSSQEDDNKLKADQLKKVN